MENSPLYFGGIAIANTTETRQRVHVMGAEMPDHACYVWLYFAAPKDQLTCTARLAYYTPSHAFGPPCLAIYADPCLEMGTALAWSFAPAPGIQIPDDAPTIRPVDQRQSAVLDALALIARSCPLFDAPETVALLQTLAYGNKDTFIYPVVKHVLGASHDAYFSHLQEYSNPNAIFMLVYDIKDVLLVGSAGL